ncbi:hypothetical protein EDC04DRAFT_2905925 [Pisolithus marmoratus]|nr:hypothetical protein EDC04DRAFT_2905925 [Pisolithus marmoratus]
MDHIDQELTKHSCNRKYLPSICAGTSLAKGTLNHYYSHMDKSEVYHIAMGNPSPKTQVILQYFKADHWEQEWIKTAEDLVRDVFVTSYMDTDDAKSEIDIEEVALDDENDLTNTNVFDNLPTTHALLCLGMWSELGLVKDNNVSKVSQLQDIEGDKEPELEDGWDHIIIN